MKLDTNAHHITAPLMGIYRHRLNIDGRGIVTLVGLHGCPLHCRYCLNNNCHTPDGLWRNMTAQELYNEVKCDELYFLATGGGVTFGGGEPALHSDYIKEFRNICGNKWNLTLESSLNVPQEKIIELSQVIDDYIIDIKSLNSNIYHSYTHKEVNLVIENLQYLISQGKENHIIVRVPLIAGYNTEDDVTETARIIQDWGIKKIDTFAYQTTPKKKPSATPTHTGKVICNILKKVRCMIAEANDISYTPTPCPHSKCISGNCPTCEKELSMLTKTLAQREHIVI